MKNDISKSALNKGRGWGGIQSELHGNPLNLFRTFQKIRTPKIFHTFKKIGWPPVIFLQSYQETTNTEIFDFFQIFWNNKISVFFERPQISIPINNKKNL